MTRWVRSGSSQKHKKMPGDATKWGEFDNQYVKKIPPKKKTNIVSQTDLKQKSAELLNGGENDEDKKRLSFQMGNLNKMSEEENISEEIHSKVLPLDVKKDDNVLYATNKRKNHNSKEKQKKQNIFDSKYSDTVSSKCKKIKIQADVDDDFSKYTTSQKNSFSQEHKKKKKKQNKKEVGSITDNAVESSSPNIFQKVSLQNHVSYDSSNESHIAGQNGEFTNSSDETSYLNSSFQNIDEFSEKQKKKNLGKLNNDSKQSSINNETSVKSENVSTKSFKSKKEMYLEKLQRKREKLGLIALPRNVECKLQKIKKRLLQKGFSPEIQKDIMRKARRKEELKHLKKYNPSKLCFNCREAGHVLADCPKKSESLKQETGICFKCGSVEHISFKCPQQVQGFPFANCFICNEQGHISRNCPKNKRGIYPKGGRCNLCGNVNHLRRDCPTLKKKEIEEENITLHTLNKEASIDAEVMINEEAQKKPKMKGKIIKF